MMTDVLGLFNWIIPSNEKVAAIEGSWWYTKIVNIQCYITGTSTGVAPVYNGITFRQRCASLWERIKTILGRNETSEVCNNQKHFVWMKVFCNNAKQLPVSMRTPQGCQVLGSSFDSNSSQFVFLNSKHDQSIHLINSHMHTMVH